MRLRRCAIVVGGNQLARVVRGTLKLLPPDVVPDVVSAVVAALPADELPEPTFAIPLASATPPILIASGLPKALKLLEVTSDELLSGWGTLQIGCMTAAVCSAQQTVDRIQPPEDSADFEKHDPASQLRMAHVASKCATIKERAGTGPSVPQVGWQATTDTHLPRPAGGLQLRQWPAWA